MFTTLQLNTLQALADNIIPADDYPSAWQAGVGNYLAMQFDRDLKEAVAVYRDGLDALEAEAQAAAGVSFAALSPEQQHELLGYVEVGRVKAAWSVDPIGFFRMAVEHMAEGYYSDPGNGGNHNRISWQMTGFHDATHD